MPRISIKKLRNSSLADLIESSSTGQVSHPANVQSSSSGINNKEARKRKRSLHEGSSSNGNVSKKVGVSESSGNKEVKSAVPSNRFLTKSNPTPAIPTTTKSIEDTKGVKSKVTLVGEADFNNDRTVYIEGLPFTSNEEEVTSFFSKCGGIMQVRLPRYQDTSRLLGYGHVLFANSSAAKKALELDGSYMQSRYIKVQPPLTPKLIQEVKDTSRVVKPPGCHTVFVKNLPYDATEDDIIESLRVCGPISKVRLAVWGHTQQQKGFGYVEFKREESAEIAVKKSATLVVKGRPVFIDFETGAPKASYKAKDSKAKK